MKRHSGDRHSSPRCIQISLRVGAIVTFFVSPPSLVSTKARRTTDHLAGPLRPEHVGVTPWRVCDSRAARGQGRFLAVFAEKDDMREMVQFTDEFVSTTFPIMSTAFAHVARTTRDSPRAEAKAWTR